MKDEAKRRRVRTRNREREREMERGKDRKGTERKPTHLDEKEESLGFLRSLALALGLSVSEEWET